MYQYTDLPSTFRTQVVHILLDILGDSQRFGRAGKYYKDIHDVLAREFGVFRLYDNSTDPQEMVFNFLLQTTDVDDALSVIEISLRVATAAQQDIDSHYCSSLSMTVTDAIIELNERFLEHGIGYQYESNKIVRIDSEFIHQEAVRPALQILGEKHYAGANAEFRKAHDHYRHQRYGETVNECLKALESTLKVICKKRRCFSKRRLRYSHFSRLSSKKKSFLTICRVSSLAYVPHWKVESRPSETGKAAMGPERNPAASPSTLRPTSCT